jgi:pilus assembly protein Flp/PilA
MKRILPMLTQYVRTLLALKADKRAVTAIEYALIASLIAVAIIGALSALGTSISGTFNSVAAKL